MDCIFCQIANKTMDAGIIYEDDEVVAFNDTFPKAPTHILIIPRKHIPTLDDVADDETLLIGKMVQTAKKLAADLGLSAPGYRIVMNCNEGGGQAVFHIHLHLLGGRALAWPPG